MSLLQDVLRTQTLDSLDKQLGSVADRDRNHSGRTTPHNDRDSDDELVGVVSDGISTRDSRFVFAAFFSPLFSAGVASTSTNVSAGTPATSSSLTVPSDPLRAFPTDVSQRIFSLLSITELAKSARVSKKWNKSQTINYVWFQHYRKENFHDDSLPPGKWTKRESKQNWRTTYLQSLASRSQDLGPIYHSYSGRSTPGSGYQTPRDVREEKWRQEAEGEVRPSKNELRGMYKELGGRKARSKAKVGAPGGMRDRGGWAEDEEHLI